MEEVTSIVSPDSVERGGLFTKCVNCGLLGAEIELPANDGHYVCNDICATSVKNSGIPANAVPSAVPISSSMIGLIYKCSLLDPKHIVDAAQWLVVGGTDSVASRVAALHSGMVDYNTTRGGPYSHLPMPLDPQMYNITMAYARRYAQAALAQVADYAPTAATLNKEAIEALRTQRATTGESEASLHVMTLWYVYATFWRRYLLSYDWASFCDLSESDRTKTKQMRPENVPLPDATTPAMVTQDTSASMKRLQVAVEAAVRLLYNIGFTKELIQSSVVNGLFADVAAGEFDIRAPDAAPGAGTPDQIVRVEESAAMMVHASSGQDEEFIRAVTESHAGITSWVKARFNRTVARAKGFTSRSGYNVVSLADRLYQLALANKCDNGMIATGAGLAIAGIYEAKNDAGAPMNITKKLSFEYKYRAELKALSNGIDLGQWRKDFDAWVGAAALLSKTSLGRDARIQSYTCQRSSSAKLAISVWKTLPRDIAQQIIAMGKYLYLSDQSSGVSAVKRQQRVKDDVKFLVNELTRKVGNVDTTILLVTISPEE